MTDSSMRSPRVNVHKITLRNDEEKIEELPSFCPRCRTDSVPSVMGNIATFSYDEESQGEGTLSVPVKCPTCFLAYIAEYNGTFMPHNGTWSYDFYQTIPRAVRTFHASPMMERISPQFCKVYDEAIAAHASCLTELAGTGYRRALEFLVKDYLIHKNHEKREIYIKTSLRNCIKDHIDNETIKWLADQATDIGNDLTHYEKITRRDILSLTSLITLVWKWIELHEETELVKKKFAGENETSEIETAL